MVSLIDQVFMVSIDAHVEVLLHQPESAIVYMRKNERSRACGDGQQFRPYAWAMRQDGSEDACGRG